MADVTSHLREAGFNDDEIANWAVTTRQNLTAAGFNDEEVDGYLGLPKTPKGIPKAFEARLAAGNEAVKREGGLLQTVPQAAALIATPEGRAQLWQAVQKYPSKFLNDMLESAKLPGEVQKGNIDLSTEEGMDQAIGLGTLVAGSRLSKLSLSGKTSGLSVATGEPVSRISRTPTGGIEDIPIGGLPKGEDFSAASTVIGHGDTTPAMEGKLAALYEEKGIHPAEVAHDAQTDVTITQSILSRDRQDMPAAYSAREELLNEKQPSSTGAAAAAPPTYSDAVRQVLSKISIDEKPPTAKLTWDKIYTNTMDRLFPIAKAVERTGEVLSAEENPYQLARLMAGSAGKADHFLNQGTFDFHSYENNGPSLKQILAPVKGDLNEFRAYIASARALELEGRGIKSGFDAGEASAPPLIAAGLDAPRTAVIEGRAKFAQPFLELVDYQNRVTAYARDAGVISDAGYKAMVQLNQLYVPFSRVMGLDEGAFIRGGGSSLQARNPVKSIKGSARDIIDPLESIIRNTHLMIEMAERNVVGTKLVDMLKRAEGEMPDLPKAAESLTVKDTARAEAMAKELAEADPTLNKVKPGSNMTYAEDIAHSLDHASAPLKEGEIAILRDGKRETYNVDPELARAMKGMDAQAMGMWERVMAYPASMLRAGSVLTPQFWARHIMRDYLYATATSTPERGLFTPWDMAKGLSGLIVKDADYWNWLKSGGANVAVAAMDRQYVQENIRKLTGQTGLVGRAWNVLADPDASMWQKTAAVPSLPFKAIEKFVIDPLRAGTQIAEEASHLAAFKKGMRAAERAEPEATNLREQIIRSGWASRDTAVDAARMGASMRAYNQIIAFGNIKLQDTDRVVRAFKDNPITATALITGAITVPAVTLWALNHDDPDYQELPQWERDFFFVVPVGTSEPSPLHVAQAQARGEAPKPSAAFFLRLPKPWAMGMIFGSGVERMLEAYKGENPHPFREFGQHLWETSGPDFVPTAAAPIVNQFANRSTFTNRTLIPSAMEKFLPEYQYTPYTTEATKALGQMIGAFPGMTKLKMDNSGWGGTARALTSPILMENYVRGWTGTLGMMALQLTDKALRMAGQLPDPPKPTGTLADIPIIQAFVVRYPSASTESVQEFQDEYARNRAFFTTWQAMAKDGNVAAMQHIQDMGGDMMFAQLDSFHQALTIHNQLVRNIYKNPDMPGDEKRQLIDQLYFGMIQVSRAGNGLIHDMREKAANVVAKPH